MTGLEGEGTDGRRPVTQGSGPSSWLGGTGLPSSFPGASWICPGPSHPQGNRKRRHVATAGVCIEEVHRGAGSLLSALQSSVLKPPRTELPLPLFTPPPHSLHPESPAVQPGGPQSTVPKTLKYSSSGTVLSLLLHLFSSVGNEMR